MVYSPVLVECRGLFLEVGDRIGHFYIFFFNDKMSKRTNLKLTPPPLYTNI